MTDYFSTDLDMCDSCAILYSKAVIGRLDHYLAMSLHTRMHYRLSLSAIMHNIMGNMLYSCYIIHAGHKWSCGLSELYVCICTFTSITVAQ